MSGIVLNVKNKPKNDYSSSTISSYVYSENKNQGKSDENLNSKQKKSIQRYLIFYDSKCRNCFVNIVDSTINTEKNLVDPTFSHSIKCHLKV